jgi:hypothetical protein
MFRLHNGVSSAVVVGRLDTPHSIPFHTLTICIRIAQREYPRRSFLTTTRAFFLPTIRNFSCLYFCMHGSALFALRGFLIPTFSSVVDLLVLDERVMGIIYRCRGAVAALWRNIDLCIIFVFFLLFNPSSNDKELSKPWFDRSSDLVKGS